MILLDTNVISELFRPDPAPQVVRFLAAKPQSDFCVSAITEAELRYGLARLPEGTRRTALAARIETILQTGFSGRILPFTSACTPILAAIRAARDAAGQTISLADALIAATARANGAIIATRDTSGFANTGAQLLNPWTDYP